MYVCLKVPLQGVLSERSELNNYAEHTKSVPRNGVCSLLSHVFSHARPTCEVKSAVPQQGVLSERSEAYPHTSAAPCGVAETPLYTPPESPRDGTAADMRSIYATQLRCAALRAGCAVSWSLGRDSGTYVHPTRRSRCALPCVWL